MVPPVNNKNRTAQIDSLRAKHRLQRRELADDTLQDHSEKLARNVIATDEYQSAVHIAAYIAILGEISVEPIIRAGNADGKVFYLPVLRNDAMFFAAWQIGVPLLEKKFGLLEPDCKESEYLDPRELDLVLAPLVVFDPQCNRIGQGGGFYDGTFEFTRAAGKPVLMGVAHDSQREQSLTPQHWDIPLHKVVTEKSIYPRITV